MSQEPNDYYRPDPHADEELVPFNVQDYSSRKGLWLLALLVLILIAALIFLLKVYQPGVRDRADAPKIVAENTPYKVEPEDAGGEVTPNQDLEIFEAMNGKKEDDTIAVIDSAEKPLKRPGEVDIEVKDQNSANTATVSPTPVPTTVPDPRPAPVTTAVGDSRYVIQLASLRSQNAAQDTWSNIQKTHSSILPRGSYADIKRAEIANKGIFYRLRLAGLANKETAQQVCDRLKARNQTCFIATK